MNSTRRAAAVAAALIVAITPAASGSPAVPPAPVPWPPPSTHGQFLPYPGTVNTSDTYPACGSYIHVGMGDVFDLQYRALVNDVGETVVEYRGNRTLDVDLLDSEKDSIEGAHLDEISVSGTWFEIYDPDGQTITYDYPGPAIVAASGTVEAEAFTEAGLPETFLYLSGNLTETARYDAAPPELGPEIPPPLTAEITENSTAYVFDLCKMLDEAPEDPEPAS